MDEKNYSELTRPAYAKALRIPFNFYYPSKYQSSAKEMIDALYGEHADLKEVEKTVSNILLIFDSTIMLASDWVGNFVFGHRLLIHWL